MSIIVPIQRELDDRLFYRFEIWIPARREHQYIGSRRKWLLALQLIYEKEHLIFYRNGSDYTAPDIEEVFEPKETKRRKEEDPNNDMKWIDTFREGKPGTEEPLRFSRKYERLKLIYLYCKLRELEAQKYSLAS